MQRRRRGEAAWLGDLGRWFVLGSPEFNSLDGLATLNKFVFKLHVDLIVFTISIAVLNPLVLQ